MAAQLQPSKDMGTHLAVLFSTQTHGDRKRAEGSRPRLTGEETGEIKL